jgi:hypothetical protein
MMTRECQKAGATKVWNGSDAERRLGVDIRLSAIGRQRMEADIVAEPAHDP